ncbi:MAG: HAMP domain-containing protein [Desulfuromonadales bacterium]|nr:HAMP domain-containing protein [Desulfuromonadales bacterium]
MPQYRPSLTVSIMAFLGLLLVLTWLLFSLLAFKTAANDLYAQKGEHARTLLAAFISQLPDPIPTYPEGIIPPDSSAAIYAQKLSEDASFTRLTLLDKNGKPIFSAGREGSDVYLPFANVPQTVSGSYLRHDLRGITHVVNIVRNGVPIARAGLEMSLDPEKARLSRTKQVLVAYFVLNFFVLLGLGSFVLSKIVVNPINRLLTATEKITSGNYGQHLKVTGSADLARLADAFNEMSTSLFSKDRQVVEQMGALERVNSDLRQAREQALHSEKMASIGLLAAGMAHEVGTPLAAIMGYAELLTGEEQDGEEVSDYARRISQECGRIDRIVRGLLDYSRPRSSGVAPVDIPQVVRESIELLNQQGAFKRITLSTYFEKGLLPALADAHQLQQVLINLLLNSRDAMPDGGKINIRVTAGDSGRRDQTQGYMLVEVLDNGMGIPPENITSLFEPFFTTKPPGRGTGLGLAISARIIEGFGGRITVKSTIGRGSCFTLWLPFVSTQGVGQ